MTIFRRKLITVFINILQKYVIKDTEFNHTYFSSLGLQFFQRYLPTKISKNDIRQYIRERDSPCVQAKSSE